MSKRDRRKEEIRQVAEKLDDLIDRMEAAIEEYRRRLDAAGPGEEPREEEGTLTP